MMIRLKLEVFDFLSISKKSFLTSGSPPVKRNATYPEIADLVD